MGLPGFRHQRGQRHQELRVGPVQGFLLYILKMKGAWRIETATHLRHQEQEWKCPVHVSVTWGNAWIRNLISLYLIDEMHFVLHY